MSVRTFTAAGLLAAVVAAPAFAGVVPTIITSPVASDADLLALLPQANMAFVAEARVGDRGGAATHEINLHRNDPGVILAGDHAQFNWANGTSYRFRLEFNAVSSLVTWQVLGASGDPVVDYSVLGGDLVGDDFFIRLRSVRTGSAVELSNLTLDGVGFGGTLAASGNDLDISRVSGGSLADGFILTGNIVKSWDAANVPSQSQLDVTFKFGETVPTPGAAALVGLGGLVALRRRR